LFAQLRREVDDVVLGDALPIERRRLRWEGLRRRCFLAGHCGLRNGSLLDRPHRSAGHAVEHVDESLLAHLGDEFDDGAVYSDVDQIWRRGRVIVPEPVVHHLKVPDPLTGTGVEADQTLAEETRAVSLASVPVVRRRAKWQIDIAEFIVGPHERPHVGAAGRFPGTVLPALVPDLALVGDSLELPELFAGAHVEPAYIAGRHLPDEGDIVHFRPHDYDVVT